MVASNISAISDIILASIKSSNQTQYTTFSEIERGIYSHMETPFTVGLGLLIHQMTRSKTLINNLILFCIYYIILGYQTAIAKTVIQEVETNNRLYLPLPIVKEQPVYFAIDNVDFKNNTRNSKNEVHGTGIIVYQSAKNSKGNLSNLNIKLEHCSDHKVINVWDYTTELVVYHLIPKTTLIAAEENINLDKIKLYKLLDTCRILSMSNDTDKEVLP